MERKNPVSGKTAEDAKLVREMYTLVARISRYRRRGNKPYSQWQAEITFVELAERGIQRVVGLKNIVRLIENFLRGRK